MDKQILDILMNIQSSVNNLQDQMGSIQGEMKSKKNIMITQI
ncbi:MAG: hypothetical protein RR657_02800 [Peptostreptococcaceae bacterium]